jgi:ionotropic glutamate receptor
VAVQEGSPLRDLLNDAILRLLNQRRLETLKERWWTDNPEKQECGDTNDQSDGISIQNIGTVDLFTIFPPPSSSIKFVQSFF